MLRGYTITARDCPKYLTLPNVNNLFESNLSWNQFTRILMLDASPKAILSKLTAGFFYDSP